MLQHCAYHHWKINMYHSTSEFKSFIDECNKFIKCRTVKTLTQKNVNREKRQTLRAQLGQTKVNLEKLKHGFFFPVGSIRQPRNGF